MKFLLALLVLIILISCSSPASQETTAGDNPEDSILLAHTDSINEESDTEEFETSDSLAAAIQAEIESLERERKTGTYHTIYARYLGYEADSDATWYFDSLLNIVYCDVNWNMEGTGGSFRFFFEGDNISAGTETNSYSDYEELVWVHKGFKPVYGFSRTDGADADDRIKYLSKEDYESTNTSTKSDYNKLLSRIREYQESAIVNGDEVSILIETVENYGEDFTVKEEFTMSKVLFDELFGN